MATSYPIRFADQLRQHLRALRKQRGLTQARLGQLLGVSQARIAEIEANPGLVNLDQLLQLFSILGATLSLAEELSAPLAEERAQAAKPAGKGSVPSRSAMASRRSGERLLARPFPEPGYSVNAPTADWNAAPAHKKAGRQMTGAPGASGKAASPEAEPAAARKLAIRPKKGTW